MTKSILLCFLLVTVGSSIEAARILGLFHVPTKSHFTIGNAVLKGLADKGHDVTVASPFPSKDKNVNYREINLEGLHEIVQEVRTGLFDLVSGNVLTLAQKSANFTQELSTVTIKNPGIKKLIEDGEKFDVLIMDMFGNEAFFGLSHIFNAHLVVICTSANDAVNHLVGNIAPYSFVPNIITPFSDRMTFVERTINTAAALCLRFYQSFYVLPGQKQLYEETFTNVPFFEETVKNVSLVLVNSHPVFETPRPYLPNMIPIGGVHIKEPNPLPKDLKKLLDNAKEGVIYFSLGSNVDSKYLPQETVVNILDTFSDFPQLVLWKIEDESLQKILPKNVKISKWFPQSDILAHPNVKLFITHGGLLSTTETVYRGVPIVGVPVYGDQFANIAKMVHSGFGQELILKDLSNGTILAATVHEVLNNKSYRENIKQNSAILKEYPQHPLDRAVYWIEHVVKTNGARYLRSSVIDLSLYEYLLLDVIAFTAVVMGTFAVGIYLSVKTLCCRGSSEQGGKRTRKAKRE